MNPQWWQVKSGMVVVVSSRSGWLRELPAELTNTKTITLDSDFYHYQNLWFSILLVHQLPVFVVWGPITQGFLGSIKYFQPPAGGGASATEHGKLCSHHKTVIKKIIDGHVLEKVKRHLSNSNAQTRVGIVGQLAGLSFGPDEYLAKKNVYNECMNTSFSSNIDHF